MAERQPLLVAHPRRLAGVLAGFLVLGMAAGLPAQKADGAEVAEAEALPTADAAPPAPEGTKVWGGAWYSASARDRTDAATISDWTAVQQAGLSFNLRSPAGLEILSDLSVNLNSITENNIDTVVQQLSIRFAPSDWLSLVAGKQRLKWGTGKVFAAIDKGEQRSDPLDQRMVLSGLSGLKAEILPTDWLGISLLAMPEPDLRWSRFAGRLDFTVTDWGLDFGLGALKYQYNPWAAEYSLSAGSGAKSLPDALAAPAAGTAVQDKLDRMAFTADAAWGAGDITLYGEAELRFGRETMYWMPGMNQAEDFGADSRDLAVFRGLAGLMWQIDLGLTRPLNLVAEYFYNGDGLDQAEAETFRLRHDTWQAQKAANPAQAGQALLPGGFHGIGNFRSHYAALALNGLAITRYLTARGSLIAGLDSGLLMGSLGLGYEFMRGVGLDIGWDVWGAVLPASQQATELLLLPFRNRLSVSVSAGF